VTASLDAGTVNQEKVEPVVFHWNLVWNFMPFFPLIGLLILLALPANRRGAAWTIAIPFLALYALVGAFDHIARTYPENTGVLRWWTSLIIIWLAVLALFVANFRRRGWLRGIVTFAALNVVVFLLGPPLAQVWIDCPTTAAWESVFWQGFPLAQIESPSPAAWVAAYWLWLASILLLAPYLTGRGSIRGIIRFILLTLLVWGVTLECYRAVDISRGIYPWLSNNILILAAVAVSLLASLLVARFLCRKRYTAIRFNVAFLAAMFVFGAAALYPTWYTYILPSGVMNIKYQVTFLREIEGFLTQFVSSYSDYNRVQGVLGCIPASLCLCGLILPFPALILGNALYRERFLSLLQMRVPPPEKVEEPESFTDDAPTRV
jgi:hypothetical protein